MTYHGSPCALHDGYALTPNVFGLPLKEALALSWFTTPTGLVVPNLLACCADEICKRGLDTEGIFRKAGLAKTINSLQEQLGTAPNPRTVDLSTTPIFVLTSLFKRYLQLLPEPVIPRDYQMRMLEAFESGKTGSEKTSNLQTVYQSLPIEHRHLLAYILHVAQAVNRRSSQNKMTAMNMAIILAPSCIGPEALGGMAKLPNKKNQSSHKQDAVTLPSKPQRCTCNQDKSSPRDTQSALIKLAFMFIKRPRKKIDQQSTTMRAVVDGSRWSQLIEYMILFGDQLQEVPVVDNVLYDNTTVSTCDHQNKDMRIRDSDQEPNINLVVTTPVAQHSKDEFFEFLGFSENVFDDSFKVPSLDLPIETSDRNSPAHGRRDRLFQPPGNQKEKTFISLHFQDAHVADGAHHVPDIQSNKVEKPNEVMLDGRNRKYLRDELRLPERQGDGPGQTLTDKKESKHLSIVSLDKGTFGRVPHLNRPEMKRSSLIKINGVTL